MNELIGDFGFKNKKAKNYKNKKKLLILHNKGINSKNI